MARKMTVGLWVLLLHLSLLLLKPEAADSHAPRQANSLSFSILSLTYIYMENKFLYIYMLSAFFNYLIHHAGLHRLYGGHPRGWIFYIFSPYKLAARGSWQVHPLLPRA